MAAPHAATKVDWQRLLTVVSSINSTTAAQLSAFKKRHDELRRTTKALEDSIPEVDFDYYRRVLKNQDIVKHAESALADFKPVKMSLDDQLAVISKFEEKAVEKAEETAKQVEAELKDLKQTIMNIETARPVDQLTLDDIAVAYPLLIPTVEKYVAKGRTTCPGYFKKFGRAVG